MSPITDRRARLLSAALALAVVGGIVLMAGMAGVSEALAHPSASASVVPAASAATAFTAPAATPAPPRATTPAPTPAATAKSSVTCPTPQNAPDWTGANFFQDALVDFQVPGYGNLSGTNFYTVPCVNVIPEYTLSFWMNVSTNVPLSEAFVTVWGTTYPTPQDPLPALDGFNPLSPQLLPMDIPSTAPNTASFLFNVYKYFYPGTTVYFNITLESSQARPATIYSTDSAYHATLPSGYNDTATWAFYVAAPWWSTTFSNDIAVATTPSILGAVPYDPNPDQAFTVGLTSTSATGALGPTIPDARLTFILSGQFSGTFSLPFAPLNASVENLSGVGGINGFGPYPGTQVKFYIQAWLPWEGGAIDEITSQNYTFNWSSGGGWANPSLGLTANALVNSTPSVFTAGAHAFPTGTPVNVTIHVPAPNETISSAVLRFTYSNGGETTSGNLPMGIVGDNTSYVRIPGLPAGGAVSFSLLAKDVFGNPVSSGVYNYTENGAPQPDPPSQAAWIYVEAVNLTSGALLPGAAFSISNSSWSGSGTTTPLGFGAFTAPSDDGYRLLGDGLYTISMTAYGQKVSTAVTLSGNTPIVVKFAFDPPGASATTGGTGNVPVVAIVDGLIIGPIVAAVAVIPLLLWYRERRAKAEAEQKRITL